jgi:hypothetical protein
MQLVASEPPPGFDFVEMRPDVLVCGALDAFDATRPRELLQLLPSSRVLMMAHSGRQAVLFELRPTRLALREVSMQSVIEAIRNTPEINAWDEVELPGTSAREYRGREREYAVGARQTSLWRKQRPRLSWREKP